LWLISKSLYCPLLCGDLIVETELDLGDHSEWIRVKETRLFVSSRTEM
jgi:hypothetical protein